MGGCQASGLFGCDIPNSFCCEEAHSQLVTCCEEGHLQLASANELVVEALAVGGLVDFPTVTEICERAQGDVLQMVELVHLLASSLQESTDPDLVTQLKVLTILHEMLYDALAVRVMIETPGLVKSLQKLRRYSLNSSDVPARELVLIFASEILKRMHLGELWSC